MDFIAAIIATIILSGLGIFQLLLALGKPYGEYAWGGGHRILPNPLRVGSAVSILLYALIASIMLDRAGVLPLYTNTSLNQNGIWFIVAYSLLGVVMNAASRSRKERNTMTPLVTVLLICAVIIAF